MSREIVDKPLPKTLFAIAEHHGLKKNRQLERRIGVNRSNIYDWMHGRSILSAESLGKFLEHVNPSPPEIDSLVNAWSTAMSLKKSESKSPSTRKQSDSPFVQWFYDYLDQQDITVPKISQDFNLRYPLSTQSLENGSIDFLCAILQRLSEQDKIRPNHQESLADALADEISFRIQQGRRISSTTKSQKYASEDSYTLAQVAQRFGISKEWARKIRIAVGIHHFPLTKDDITTMQGYRAKQRQRKHNGEISKMTNAEAVHKLGIPESTLYHLKSAMGIPHGPLQSASIDAIRDILQYRGKRRREAIQRYRDQHTSQEVLLYQKEENTDTTSIHPDHSAQKRYEHRGYRFEDTKFVHSLDFLIGISEMTHGQIAELLHIDRSVVSAARTGHSLLGEMDTRSLLTRLKLPLNDVQQVLQQRETALQEKNAHKAGVGAHDMFPIRLEMLELPESTPNKIKTFTEKLSLHRKDSWKIVTDNESKVSISVLRRIVHAYGISLEDLVDRNDPRVALLQPTGEDILIHDSPLHRKAVALAFPNSLVKQELVLGAAAKGNLTVKDTYFLAQAVAQMKRNIHPRSLLTDEEWKRTQIRKATQRHFERSATSGRTTAA